MTCPLALMLTSRQGRLVAMAADHDLPPSVERYSFSGLFAAAARRMPSALLATDLQSSAEGAEVADQVAPASVET